MASEKNFNRRRFLSMAALTFTAAKLAPLNVLASTGNQHKDHYKNTNQSQTSFTEIKQVKAGLLNVGYAETGPANGQPVILLHGWPYDIQSYAEAAGLLAAKGYRVIVPHLRGHGSTQFLSAQTFRNGQQAAVALDIIALMDALNIKKAIIGGFDWGARTANIIAALWPERCKAMVSVNGYLINNLERNKQPLPPKAEWGWWYQYYFATDRGQLGYTANWHDFNKLIWKNISPKWDFDDATYERSAASFKNPDYVAIVIHNYRWRLSTAPGEAQYDVLEKQLAAAPVITVPTVTLDGDSDGVVPASDGSAFAKMFTGKHVHHIIKGAGHNLPQEAPRAFADAIMEADSFAK
ncbi:Pimeloyl-ACP methyl ester carboxylesterase [Chitinophaga rupis]|uniref:Pimeloyl-ACP methyl ester carboxylesterase n=1 Tax=Chitinophaga rupis TaxID=573321 RepID=A0A1H8HES1_9BACT|nr:alpha/beta hydrolase [Chitinophaga rupis]SEN54761.1 Pimeloyl-ACP methyl ester carboxylesterase [Chitinophaga rupis]